MGLMTAGGGLTTSKLVLADAAEGDVLNGKTFYAAGKALRAGTMPNNGAWGTTVNAGSSVTIPKGYHNGNGKVTGSYKTRYIFNIVCNRSIGSGASVSFMMQSGQPVVADTRANITSFQTIFDTLGMSWDAHSYGVNLYLQFKRTLRTLSVKNLWTDKWDASGSVSYLFPETINAGTELNMAPTWNNDAGSHEGEAVLSLVFEDI